MNLNEERTKDEQRLDNRNLMLDFLERQNEIDWTPKPWSNLNAPLPTRKQRPGANERHLQEGNVATKNPTLD